MSMQSTAAIARARVAVLAQQRNGKKVGPGYQKYKKYKHFFCPVGHYIYFINLENKNIDSEYFLQSFCAMAKIYDDSFYRIKEALKYNADFMRLYRT